MNPLRRKAGHARWAKWRAAHPEKAARIAAGKALAALRRLKPARQERTEALRRAARARWAARHAEHPRAEGNT
jgi:hypothetical protein